MLLLLFPADKLLPTRADLRSFDCLSGLRDYHRRRSGLWLIALTLDPFRGFAGAWLLMHALRLSASAWPTIPFGTFGILLSVLALGTISQTITARDRGVLLAPIGFIGGAVIALVPGYAPLLAVALALTAMFGFRQFYAFFAAGMLVLPLLGLLFEASPAFLVGGTMMFSLPLMLAMLTNCVLEVPWVYSDPP